MKPSYAPVAIGPYAPAIAAGPFVFCSGQTPIDPATGKLIDGDIEAQARRVPDSLAAGLTLRDVVKTAVFAPHKPARSTIQVAKNPLDARVEIECIACHAST